MTTPTPTPRTPDLPDAQDTVAEATLLTWRIHRLRTEPRRLGLVVAAYGAALLLWATVFPHPLTLFLPVAALTSAMAEYLFPVNYRLTTRGAYANCLFSRLYLAWSDVQRATCGEDGVFLSPLPRPSRLDTFRGIRLAFADGNDETVLTTVRHCRAEQAALSTESALPVAEATA